MYGRMGASWATSEEEEAGGGERGGGREMRKRRGGIGEQFAMLYDEGSWEEEQRKIFMTEWIAMMDETTNMQLSRS
eukprot:749884-Hanusia_phi.AAC.1